MASRTNAYDVLDETLRNTLDYRARATTERVVIEFVASQPRHSIATAVQLAQQLVERDCPEFVPDELGIKGLRHPPVDSAEAWSSLGYRLATDVVSTTTALPVALIDANQAAARHRHAPVDPASPSYEELPVSDFERILLRQLWRVGVYVVMDDHLPDSTAGTIRVGANEAMQRAPLASDRADEAYLRIHVNPAEPRVMSTVVRALASIASSGYTLNNLYEIEARLIVYLVASRLGLDCADDPHVEDYLYGPAVSISHQVRFPVILAVAESVESVLRGDVAPVGMSVLLVEKCSTRTFGKVAQLAGEVVALLDEYSEPGQRAVAEHIVADAVAGNPQWAPSDAAIIGLQLARRVAEYGDLLALSTEDISALARGTWATAMEWDIGGYTINDDAAPVILPDGTQLFLAADATPQKHTLQEKQDAWFELGCGFPSTITARVLWGLRSNVAEGSRARYQDFGRYGVSERGRDYLANLWRIGMIVAPVADGEQGFTVGNGIDADGSRAPIMRMSPSEHYYLVQVSTDDYANTFGLIAKAVVALFLGHYNKLWASTPATPRGGVAEIAVATAILLERLGMDSMNQSRGADWFTALAEAGQPLEPGFDYAAVLEAVEKAEDVFRGLVPALTDEF